MKTQARQKGFTLIELLVVATIIIVISAIGLVSFTNTGRSARDSKRKADLETVRQGLVLYRSENGTYPAGPQGVSGAQGTNQRYNSVVALLATSDFLSQPTPVDPKNDATYQYTIRTNGSTDTPANTFCVCARVEDTTKGNSNNSSCNFGAGTTFYCVENP